MMRRKEKQPKICGPSLLVVGAYILVMKLEPCRRPATFGRRLRWGGKKKKRSGNLWSGTIKDRYQLRIVKVYHCYGLLPRPFPCAATEVRDDTMDDQCAGFGHSRAEHFHLSRRNVHVSLHAPECFTELARDSGDRSGYTVVLKPLPRQTERMRTRCRLY